MSVMKVAKELFSSMHTQWPIKEGHRGCKDRQHYDKKEKKQLTKAQKHYTEN